MCPMLIFDDIAFSYFSLRMIHLSSYTDFLLFGNTPSLQASRLNRRKIVMDGQRPPNDPRSNQRLGVAGKADPSAGRGRARSRNGVEMNENGEMDMIGNDLRDQGMVVMMFLFGLASFLLRDHCTC